ncbi:hypothetical protein PAMA_004691 [Pampus argenteus]
MSRERRKTENQGGDGDRGQWANKTEYILVVAGNVVGLGNVWRFPYLCYKNGGGAFLVPYCLLAVLVGIPLFLLESSIGQYTQEGFITTWRKLCPLAQGIGYGHFIMKMYDFGYILIQVWALFYLVFSFSSQLPWATCDNTWNTANCVGLQSSDSMSVNQTANRTMLTNTISASTEFWEDCFWLCLLNSGTSFVAGFVVFSVLGFMAQKQGVTVDAVAESGADRVINIIEDMTGQKPSVYFKVCWRYIIPLLSLVSFILYLFDYTHLRINDRYVYPDWANTLGWTMTLSSVLMVPLWAAGQMCLTTGTFRQRLSVLCRPGNDSSPQRRKMREDVTTVELTTSAGTA